MMDDDESALVPLPLSYDSDYHEEGELVYFDDTTTDKEYTLPKLKRECSYCGKKFIGSSALVRHMRTHTGEKPYECKVCKGLFTQSSSLNRHIRKVHGVAGDSFVPRPRKGKKASVVEINNIIVPKRIKSFECETCGEGFTIKSNLIRHVRRSPFCGKHCKACGKSITDFGEFRYFNKHGGRCKSCGEEVDLKSFECNLCNKKFASAMGLHGHKKAHSDGSGDGMQFKCKKCNSAFAKAIQLMDHMKKHNAIKKLEKMHKCKFCSRSFDTSLGLYGHMKQHSRKIKESKIKPRSAVVVKKEDLPIIESTMVRCDVCNIRFSHPIKLQTHMKIHAKAQKFKCKFCDRKFSKYLSLRGHLKQHSQQIKAPVIPVATIFKCKVCNKPFTNRLSLRGHMQMHSKLKMKNVMNTNVVNTITFDCKYCTKSFANSLGLRGHLKQHSGQIAKTRKIVEGGKPFPCDFCDKVFQNFLGLRGHLRVHSGQQPYQCKVCSKKFFYTDSMEEHMKSQHVTETVEAEEPEPETPSKDSSDWDNETFQCLECNKMFTRKGNLKQHMLLHNDIKPYKCKKCNSGFTRSNHLKRHMETHHEAEAPKPFKCIDCGCAFAELDDLLQHMEVAKH